MNEATIKQPKNKYVYLEVMRIIAIFFVIFNHTGNTGFFLFSQRPIGGLQFWIYLFISIFCKFSVPLFFAISGALMLNREHESLKILWKKRVLKILIVLIVFSLVYYFKNISIERSTFKIETFIKTMYSSRTAGHLWYLYAYIAYLISLPFLKSLTRNLNTKYFYYMTAITIIYVGLLPTLEYLLFQGKLTLTGNLKPGWIYSNIVIYPCIGYFMQYRLDLKKIKDKLLLIWISNFAGIILSCYMTYYKGTITGVITSKDSQSFHNSFVLLNCIAIFLTIKYLFEHINLPIAIEKLICSIGECTFGIYLIHVLVKDSKLMNQVLVELINLGCNYMIASFVQCICIMLFSYLIILIMKRIPILKNLIGF